MFKGFKAIGVMHGVVTRKDNGKVGGCSDGCIAGSGGLKGCCGSVGFWLA